MGFGNSVRKRIEEMQKEASDRHNEACQELFDLTVNYSPSPAHPGPYALGLLVNQWFPSTVTPSTAMTGAKNDNGRDSFDRIDAFFKTNPFNKDTIIYLTNSTEEAIYADKLGWTRGEGKNGWVWSGKPAYYMRDKAILNVKAKYT